MGSASLRERQLTLTVTNSNLTQPREAEVAVRGATIKSVQATTLTASDVKDHNSFDDPRRIEPREGQLTPTSASVLVHSFAPASVTRLRLDLG